MLIISRREAEQNPLVKVPYIPFSTNVLGVNLYTSVNCIMEERVNKWPPLGISTVRSTLCPLKTNKQNPSTVAFHIDQNKQIRKKNVYFAINKYEKKYIYIPEALPFITNSDHVERNFRVKWLSLITLV